MMMMMMMMMTMMMMMMMMMITHTWKHHPVILDIMFFQIWPGHIAILEKHPYTYKETNKAPPIRYPSTF